MGLAKNLTSVNLKLLVNIFKKPHFHGPMGGLKIEGPLYMSGFSFGNGPPRSQSLYSLTEPES